MPRIFARTPNCRSNRHRLAQAALYGFVRGAAYAGGSALVGAAAWWLQHQWL